MLPAGELAPGRLKPGTLDARWGEAAAACCRKAVELAKAGEVAGITSAPFNKEAFHMAGYKAMDDMTYFEECFAKGEAYQVGEVAGIWTTPVTFHVAFRAIPDLITKESVLAKIRSLDKVLKAAKVESGQDRRGGAERPRRRGRDVRPGGDRRHRARHPAGQGRGLQRRGAAASGQRLPARPAGRLSGASS